MRPSGLLLLALAVVAAAACTTRPSPPTASTSGAAAVSSAEALPGEPMALADAAPPATSEAPEARPHPHYDLAAELEKRTALARSRFGAKVRTRIADEVFLFVNADGGGAFEGSVALARRTYGALLATGTFRQRPLLAVTVNIFSSDGAYHRFCARAFQRDCISPFGWYDRVTREIFANASTGPGTTSHEIVHPLVEADFLRTPVWFFEGLGSLYEQPLFDAKGRAHGAKDWRYTGLASALRTDAGAESVGLDALFRLPNAAFDEQSDAGRGDIGLDYAESRSFCEWMDAQNLLWKFYAAWRDAVADDPTGESTFQKVTSRTLEDATVAWRNWVLSPAMARAPIGTAPLHAW